MPTKVKISGFPVNVDKLNELRIDGQAIILAARRKKVGFSSGFTTANNQTTNKTPLKKKSK